METLDELAKGGSGNVGFFKHVFNFNNESRAEMLNIVQYAVLALVPIVFLNKMMQRYVPEADEENGSLEILGEVLIQITIMFLGILLVHRIITYVPTYSGEKYADFSVTNIILGVLVIILSLQTKLGEKVSILVDRLGDAWNGPQNDIKEKKNNIKISQPIVQGQGLMNKALMLPNQIDMNMGTTSITDLPQVTNNNTNNSNNYNNTNQQLMGSSDLQEPMAANSALGGGGMFGNAFNW